jgi:hypothetical protein
MDNGFCQPENGELCESEDNVLGELGENGFSSAQRKWIILPRRKCIV